MTILYWSICFLPLSHAPTTQVSVYPCKKGVLVIVHGLSMFQRMVGWGLSHVCLTSWNWPCTVGFIESCGCCVTVFPDKSALASHIQSNCP